MTVENKLSKNGFYHTVAAALEDLRQDHPEIEWVIDEDQQIVVWLDRGGRDVCHFCDAEVEYIGSDWYNVVDGTTDCGKTGGHVVIA